MAKPQNIARQEQIIAEAQKRLDRIEKMREEMVKQVEQEIQRLNDLREKQGDFTQSSQTEPALNNTSPASFQSQFDQFSTTKSNERLKPINTETPLDFTGKLNPPKNDTPSYRQADRREHYESADTQKDPGRIFYVSGYYSKSGSSSKTYEYTLWPTAGNVNVGDIVSAPVHPHGYHTSGRKSGSVGHDLEFVITDIYTNEKYYGPHDFIK